MLKSPFTGGPTELVFDEALYPFRGQEFLVKAPAYKCVDSGELFTTDEQDQVYLDELHRLWRERNGVPTSEQLIARRQQLGLSAKKAGLLLGLGVNQFSKYEKGELPSESNMILLQQFCDHTMWPWFLKNRAHVLPEKIVKKLKQHRPVVAKLNWPINHLAEQLAFYGGCAFENYLAMTPPQVAKPEPFA
ncbi:type II TA system antitoxin MqsA family protein [Hymenobacter crusticola]|nr:type II TA system antitoxin MqsA family protein [Hymenobacter crusticola]